MGVPPNFLFSLPLLQLSGGVGESVHKSKIGTSQRFCVKLEPQISEELILMNRPDGRAQDELRPIRITPNYLSFAEGSVLIEMGETRVLCAVTLEDKTPLFVKEKGTGWVTAEYAMLPRSTLTRSSRSKTPNGRSQEIQRLIGRSLRAITDLSALGDRTFTIDCDVIQADGGTRTAAITGAYIALYIALEKLVRMAVIPRMPFKGQVAATSVGIVNGQMLLDLCYEEDSHADVDFNVVMTDKGEFVEIQGTAESVPFPRPTVDALISLAEKGIRQLHQEQLKVLGKVRG
jgi:ribonuclease PH